MSVKLKTPSNGSVTLAPADTASDVVVTVPAGTSTMVTNATLPTQLNASGSAPIYACRAWVNFNGTGTVAIRASGNVTSITDNGGGDYTLNFTTAMPDADYASVALRSLVSTSSGFTTEVVSQTASACRVISRETAGADPTIFNVVIFR
jgi:hypothetical protein